MVNEVFNEQEVFLDLQQQTIERFLKSIRDYDDSLVEKLTLNGYKLHKKDKRTVIFTFGEVTFYRNRWSKNGEYLTPVDDMLGLEKYQRYSKQLRYEIAQLANYTSYRKVVDIVETTYKVHITKDIVRKVVKEAGEILEEKESYRFYEDDSEIEKIQADTIYLEGDGVMIKTIDESTGEVSNTELNHFVCHTGSQQVAKNRFALENKKSFISDNNVKVRQEVLDYIYNHFEITDETMLVTNSDHGKGYTPYIFKEFAELLQIKKHEHFWDAYHLNKLINDNLKPFPKELMDKIFQGITIHDKAMVRLALNTAESMIENEEHLYDFSRFSRRLLQDFQYTKPAELRNLPQTGIGVMETQHRKVTYRMKKQGKYWSKAGAVAMSKMILLNSEGKLRELFLGNWREDYAYYSDLEKINPKEYLKQTKSDEGYYMTGKYHGKRKL